MTKRYMNILIPVVAVLLGLIAGAVIMLISGYNPIVGYEALWNGAFGDSFYIGETLRKSTPYILAGLSVAFAFRTGLFNIGVEGQLLVGWIASVWVGTSFHLPMYIHLPFAIIAAMLAGAIWGAIPGFLKAKFKVHEVIVTIMLNYTALYIANYLVRNVLTHEKDKTESVHSTASLQSTFLQNITDISTLHNGIYVALLAAVVMWLVLEKTKKGFELRSVGFNKHASHYAGMNVDRNIMYSMIIAGGFAGIGGAMDGLGTYGYAFIQSGFSGVGFDGIAIALLGNNTAIGVVISSILFGALRIGALNMQTDAGVPEELVEMVIALIIFFVASSYLIKWILNKFNKGGK